MKGKEFNEETRKVYSECHRVLKKDGKMVVHMKNYVKGGKIVRLDKHTIDSAKSVGFKYIEKKRRHIEHPSFWQIQYQQKHPDAPHVNYEDVLVFQKI